MDICAEFVFCFACLKLNEAARFPSEYFHFISSVLKRRQ